VGDLSLNSTNKTLQQALFDAIQEKIISQKWQIQQKLPSTRRMAEELKLSRNTVISAYEQLAAEGYLHSKKGAGFFVSVSIPEEFLTTRGTSGQRAIDNNRSNCQQQDKEHNRPFTPGIPDLGNFPYSKWQSMLHRHTNRATISGVGDIQGYYPLRDALSQYLQSSRSVSCNANQIIITSGAQQALSISVLATLKQGSRILMEEPGYPQMRKILNLFNCDTLPFQVEPTTGIDLTSLSRHQSEAIYLTPSNQYPMGTSLNTEQRLQILRWAKERQSWIIEDDYDSEFQFSHRPYASLQGLSAQSGVSDRCIYVGSFSKTLFNGLRVGYMVVPENLVSKCLDIKDALAGRTAVHTQAALADFIAEGHFLRHLRKMRKLYQQKSDCLAHSIKTHFAGKWTIISQSAGLHTTVKWYGAPTEEQMVELAHQQGITVRPLSYYEHLSGRREWNSLVLGYGNAKIEEIDERIKTLAQCFLGSELGGHEVNGE
jgi:GntR family transcriptional regulator/MocR family aminotransferase